MANKVNRPRIEALAQICNQLGGKLVIVSWRELLDLNISIPDVVGSHCEYGIDWEQKIVYVQHGTNHIGFLIHEMGHVFADRYPPDDNKCDEWEWFGWEVALAQKIGAFRAWSRHNAGYHMGDGIVGGFAKDKDWSELSTKARRKVVADRLAYAKKIGVIDEGGNPRSVR